MLSVVVIIIIIISIIIIIICIITISKIIIPAITYSAVVITVSPKHKQAPGTVQLGKAGVYAHHVCIHGPSQRSKSLLTLVVLVLRLPVVGQHPVVHTPGVLHFGLHHSTYVTSQSTHQFTRAESICRRYQQTLTGKEHVAEDKHGHDIML